MTDQQARERLWFQVVRKVVNKIHASGIPYHIAREDLEGYLIGRIPDIIKDFEGRRNASESTFLFRSLLWDAKNYIKSEKRHVAHASESLSSADVRSLNPERPEKGTVANAADRWANGDMSRPLRSGIGCHGEVPQLRDIYSGVFHQARDILTEKQWETVVCKFAEGMTWEEVADEVGTTVDGAKSHWKHARKKLHAGLKKNPSNRYLS